MNKLFPISIIALLLSGCLIFGPGDGGFRVIGNIEQTKNGYSGDCILKIIWLGETDTPDDFSQERKVSGSFEELFIVSPDEEDYMVSLKCKSGIEINKRVTYGIDTSPDNPVDLGKIKLPN